MLVVMALLFAALSPGVLIWLPVGASRRVAALALSSPLFGIFCTDPFRSYFLPLREMLPWMLLPRNGTVGFLNLFTLDCRNINKFIPLG